MNRLLRVAALAGLLAAAGPLRAQDDPNLATGLTPYQSFHGGDVDSVNLSNGNVVSHAPLVSYPQRGGKLRVAFDLVGNGKGAYIYKFCPPQHACVLLWVLGSSVRVLDNQQIGGGESNIIQLQQGGQTNKYLVFAVETPDGSLHTMALTNIGYYSIDGTGLFAGGQTYDYGWGPPYCTFHCGGYIDRDGIWYEPPRALVAREDPNGNQIAYTDSSYTAYLDTVGRTIPLPPAPSTSADLTGCTGPTTTYSAAIWNVPGPNGGSVTYKLCYGTQVLQGPTKCGAIYEPPITLHYLQSVLLPNNKSWVFEYNDRDPGDPSNINYGSLTKVTFPTGGTISYIYQTVGCGFIHASRSVISRTVDALDGPGGTSNPHTWTYTWGGGNLFSTPNTVTDPLGNDTVHSFSAFGTLGAAPYETQAQYYQGSKSTGTLLKTVNTSYITLANPTAGYIGPGAAALPTQVTTVWPDGKQTQIQKDYDAGPVFATNPLNPICCTFSTPGSYGDVTAEREYDYGSGAPGPLLRQTANTYLALSNTTYLDSNLLNLKSQVAVFSGSITSGDCSVNSAKACTKYTYDDQSPGLQSSGISTQHDSSPPLGTTYRGNQTSVSRWLNTSSSYLKSTAVFYDTGMVYQSTDPLLNTTTFTYSATFAGAYPTEIQLPTTGSVQHITYKNYDFNTGLLASHTDENGNQTTFSYDNMFRLKQVTFPTGGGQATVTRQETTFPFTATLTRQITGSLNMVTTNVFDGVGRVTQTQLTSDPDGTTYTDFTYDALGRKSTVSNPHRTQSAPTDGITTYNYDALGRTTKVIPPDGSSSSNYVLTQYCDNVTLATDQASHWRRSTVDGLGRMTEVDEPNSTSATVNVCPGTGEPIWATTYAYDTLNNLTNVTQSSSRQRTFVHDSLSRLTSSTNPEAGNVTYTYDADGNVKTKKDARNITITYSYDPLNRVLSSTYSNGDPTISYTYDQSACLGQSPCYNIGHRTGMTDAAGSEAWAYDTMGREAAEQRTTNSITKTTTYTYNLDGSLATLTYPSGRVITYAPGGAGRPLSAVDNTNSINYALSGTYAPQGALATLLLGKTNTFNGINLNDSFDSRLQPCRVFASTSTSVPNNCSDLQHAPPLVEI